jgi:bacterioferritin
VAYEQKLIPHYMKEAELVDDPHIKRVLQREAWESEMHATKFQRTHDKLSAEQAAGLPSETNELPEPFIESIQQIIEVKYTQMLQSIRDAWVFQDQNISGWKIIDFSFTNMKQLAHVAEEMAENGIAPRLNMGAILTSSSIGTALSNILESVDNSRKLHKQLKNDPESKKHSGLMINLDLSIAQEAYEADEIKDMLE